jgi:murein DD-endopeptidase MepM/ murein hydrolase activator NlpD
MRTLFLATLAFASLATTAQALDVRFYPGERVYAYELSAAQGASSVLLHNIAIINDGSAPVALSEVAIELTQGDRVLDRRVLGATELGRAAAGGAGMQQAGLLEPLAFQFGGAQLLPAGTTLSPDLTLDPGEAIMITSQVFAFRGARDGVHVRVNGDAAQGALAIRTGGTQMAYAFPLRGQWYNGAGASFHTHHRWTPMEEFAFDFVRYGSNGRTYRRSGERFTDYYAYGEPVLAAAAGRVVYVVTDQSEDASAMKRPEETIEAYFARLRNEQMTRIAGGAPTIGGNQVIIDHGNGEFSFYGHLRPGSVRVRAGDQVERLQQVGAIGSSGNSTEPHLHFHICNSADPLMCAGIPVQFEPLEFGIPDPPRQPQSGDLLRPLHD